MAAKTRPATDIAFLCRALKAPSLAQAYGRLADRARTDHGGRRRHALFAPQTLASLESYVEPLLRAH